MTFFPKWAYIKGLHVLTTDGKDVYLSFSWCLMRNHKLPVWGLLRGLLRSSSYFATLAWTLLRVPSMQLSICLLMALISLLINCLSKKYSSSVSYLNLKPDIDGWVNECMGGYMDGWRGGCGNGHVGMWEREWISGWMIRGRKKRRCGLLYSLSGEEKSIKHHCLEVTKGGKKKKKKNHWRTLN